MAARDCILVTGAAGFLGSHIARLAHDQGSKVWAIDDLSLTRDWPKLPRGVVRVPLQYQGPIPGEITGIVHCAGLSCVSESMRAPGLYWKSNVDTLSQWLAINVRDRPIVFASSSSIYGHQSHNLHEADPPRVMSPYGSTKIAAEHLLRSYQFTGLRWTALRLFNLAGAHPDGSLHENHDPETHLIPLAIDAALGLGPKLKIFGDQHDTLDGTQERDYVHVMDAAQAFLRALDVMDRDGVALGPLNVGSSSSYSVIEVMTAIFEITGEEVPHEFVDARAGDPTDQRAMTGEIYERLSWSPERSNDGLKTIIEDAVRSRRGMKR